MDETTRDMTSQEMIGKLNNDVKKAQKKIAELKEELEELKKEHAATLWEYCDSVKKEEHEKALNQIERDQAKIAELISEIDCKRSEIMPDEPIKAADCLIHAKGTRETNAIQRMCGAGPYENYDLYSVSDLREIAEHLLAYCNNN